MVIPKEDWVCHLCQIFPDKDSINNKKLKENMECLLCPNKGGAMKPCTIRRTSHSYLNIMKERIKYENNEKQKRLKNTLK